MEAQILGKTGLRIAPIGFGGIPIQRLSAKETRVLFDRLIDAGINFIDTAHGYTVSEEYIGTAIAGRRERFILATKSMARTADEMAADIQTSLTRLGTDYIDLYQVHNPNAAQLDTVCGQGGALEALLAAKAAGKIGHIGITCHSLEVFARAVELDWVETVMFPYNIVETRGEELIARCRERNIGFIAMKPLAGGAIENGTIAIRFLLQNPAVSVIIPGMQSADEIFENVMATDYFGPLREKEWEEIREIRARLNENFCRRCNYCAPCKMGIEIPKVFLFAGYLERYGLEDWARNRYASLAVPADACVGCGICETRCPYHLPIREMMKKAAESFGGCDE